MNQSHDDMTLQIATCNSLNWDEVKEIILGNKSARVIGYSPINCSFVHASNIRDIDESTFELRAFCEVWELRWLKNADGGKAAVWTHCDVFPNGFAADDKRSIHVKAMDNQYVMWGKVSSLENQADGYCNLTSPRIGNLKIPFVGQVGEQLVLKTWEYFRTEEYGNVVFAGERLCGVEELKKENVNG